LLYHYHCHCTYVAVRSRVRCVVNVSPWTVDARVRGTPSWKIVPIVRIGRSVVHACGISVYRANESRAARGHADRKEVESAYQDESDPPASALRATGTPDITSGPPSDDGVVHVGIAAPLTAQHGAQHVGNRVRRSRSIVVDAAPWIVSGSEISPRGSAASGLVGLRVHRFVLGKVNWSRKIVTEIDSSHEARRFVVDRRRPFGLFGFKFRGRVAFNRRCS